MHGRPFQRLRRAWPAAIVAACAACGGEGAAPRVTPAADDPPYVERARELGIDFVHFNGMTGEYHFCEPLGAGAALFDYDNDGDLDAYLLQGQLLGTDASAATFPPPGPLPLSDRLFRNELVETGSLRFTDVTAGAGLDTTGYGMGVAAGDYDGDGRLDLYVTRFGGSRLLHNEGQGRFRDVTAATGTADDRWSTSAAFVDYDADGRLDLLVARYTDFTLATNKACFSGTSARDYCGPLSYGPIHSRLFHNRGDGTFEDVTLAAGLARRYGAGLGVSCADFDRDGWIDLYIANDAHPNQLWINRGDGTFEDTAVIAGCAVSKDGRAESSMGIDAGDFDNDGDEDLFITNLLRESHALYRNDGAGRFDDVRAEVGVKQPVLPYTGFGTAWTDFDNDGWLDLLIVNGHIQSLEARVRAGDPYPLDQHDQLFRNLEGRRFEELTQRAGPAFAVENVGRAAAFGDVDNDGDADVLISDNNGPARLLINEVGNRNHWLGLRLLDRAGRLDVLHAEAEVVRGDGSRLRRRARAAASYLSSNDPRVLIGLGREAALREIRVRWPDRTVEVWEAPEADRYVSLRQGSGRPAAP